MITTVSSSAALATALKSAHGGDTILLAAGSYSALSLSGLNFASAVTIKSADTAHEAVINGLTLNNVSGLSFSSLAFATNGGTAVSLYSSSNLSFDSIGIHGAALGSGNGMIIRDTSGVSVTNSDIGQLGTGINELNASNLTITGNTFHDISSGDIRGTGATNETISGNAFQDAKAGVANHSDVINLWQDNTANHVTITNNSFGPTVTQPVVTSPPPVVTQPVVTSPPPATSGPVTVSSSAALATALKSAHAGDTILLASGTYSAVSLSGLHFTSAVTIQSADSAHEAVINGLTVNNSSGLAFNHIDFAANGGTAVSVYSSQNVAFDSINEHGAALGDGNGMLIRDSSGVSLTNSNVGKLGTGVNELSSTNLTITGNTFHDISSGAIRGAGTTNETISGNTFTDANASIANHSDVIQLWQDNTANHVTITDNIYGAAPTSPVLSVPIVSQPVISSPSTTPSSPAPSTGATVTVSTSDGLWAALKAAHNGDTILLAPGTYSPISLWQFNIDGNVTVQSADNAHMATLTGLKILSSSGMTFQNLDMPVDNGATAVTVLDSSNIKLSNLNIHGTAATDIGLGVSVGNSTGVTVENSEITRTGSGIGFINSNHLNFSNNYIHNIETDGIVGGGASDVLVQGNHFDTFHPLVGDHPDAIQFFGASDGSPSNNVVISDNVITRGTADAYQGIFIENTNNVTITENAMSGTMYAGISVSHSNTALVEHNYVDGYSDMDSRIIVRGQSSNVSVIENTSQSVINYTDGGVPNTNYVASGNTLIPGAAMGDDSGMNSWLSQHLSQTSTGWVFH